MQTSDIERPLPGHDLSVLPRRFTFLVYPPSLRATTTIYIVTGGAVLYSPFIPLRRGKFRTGEISRANIRTRNNRAERRETTFSRARIPVVTTLGIAPWNARARLSSKNLHVRDRPILASGQVSVPDLRNSSCREVGPRSSAAIYIGGWRQRWKAAAGFNAHASCIFKAPAWYSCTRKLNPNARLRMASPPSLSLSRSSPDVCPPSSSRQVSFIENQNSGELVR